MESSRQEWCCLLSLNYSPQPPPPHPPNPLALSWAQCQLNQDLLSKKSKWEIWWMNEILLPLSRLPYHVCPNGSLIVCFPVLSRHLTLRHRLGLPAFVFASLHAQHCSRYAGSVYKLRSTSRSIWVVWRETSCGAELDKLAEVVNSQEYWILVFSWKKGRNISKHWTWAHIELSVQFSGFLSNTVSDSGCHYLICCKAPVSTYLFLDRISFLKEVNNYNSR